MNHTKLFDLEQAILTTWTTQDDIYLLIEAIEHDSAISKQEIVNHLKSIASIHDLRCQKTFSVYEDMFFKRPEND